MDADSELVGFTMLRKFALVSTSLKKMLFIFRERGREGGRGRETSMYERHMDWLPLARPQWVP